MLLKEIRRCRMVAQAWKQIPQSPWSQEILFPLLHATICPQPPCVPQVSRSRPCLHSPWQKCASLWCRAADLVCIALGKNGRRDSEPLTQSAKDVQQAEAARQAIACSARTLSRLRHPTAEPGKWFALVNRRVFSKRTSNNCIQLATSN